MVFLRLPPLLPKYEVFSMTQSKTLPPIGARIVKSSLGAAICILIYYIRELLPIGSGIPFYSILAVLYDLKENRYLEVFALDRDTAVRAEALLEDAGVHVFVNALYDNTLHIYYGEFQNEAEQDLFQRLRRSPYRNYTAKRLRLTGDSERVIYLMVLTPDEQIPALVGRLSDAFGSTVRIVTAPATEDPGYTYLKLYHRDARKANMLEILKERTGVDKVITFGSIPGEYDVFVHDDGGNSAVKAFKRLYEGRPVKS